MSTTITYNGSTIAQVNNETKTLLTSGKWLTGNIILTDVSDGSGGGTGTLTTKNITQNGTYLASDDNADGYSSVTVNVSSGGGTTMTVTGTVTGNGSNILQIPCDFEPDLIHIHGDLFADIATRGIVSLTIIKDMDIYYGQDTSTSASVINFAAIQNITGYNESDTSDIHATYSNNMLSVDTVKNSGSVRWTSGITYSYKLIKFG